MKSRVMLRRPLGRLEACTLRDALRAPQGDTVTRRLNCSGFGFFHIRYTVMTLNLRTQILIGTAATAIVAVLGMAVLLLNQIGPGPAALLPAERTLALVANIHPEERSRLQVTMPWMQTLPDLNAQTPVAAYVRNPDGTIGWVTFNANGQSSTTVRGDGERALTDDDAFRPLSSTYEPGSSWIFARFPDVSMNIAGINPPQEPMSLTIGTGSLQIAWEQNGPSLPSLSSAPAMSDESTVISMDAGNLATILTKAAEMLSDTQRLALESVLRGWSSRLFGPEISPQYDLLTLTDAPASLTLTNLSGGSLAAILSTNIDEDADKTVARLHRAVRSATAESERMQRTFDTSFNVDILMQREPAVSSGSVSGGWTLDNTVTRDDDSGFFSALKGEQVVLSTNNNLIQQFLHARRLSPEPGTIARGSFSVPALSAVLNRIGLSMNLPALFPGSAQIDWQLMRKGNLHVLQID